MTNSMWQFDEDVVWKKLDDLVLGFGRKDISIETLREKFQKFSETPLQWAHLNQIHSKSVVRSDFQKHSGVEADAHYTFDRGVALVVKTADCIPALIHGPASDKFPNGVIAAVHAGWRGIENEILAHTIQKLKAEGVDSKSLAAVMGPHIRAQSFEVDSNVAELLRAAGRRLGVPENDFLLPGDQIDRASPKSFIHLDKIATGQLLQEGLNKNLIEIFKENGVAPDTKPNVKWASFRRDGANAGRNHSFIVRL